MGMQYRGFGRLGLRVSALGFGAMRLPTRNGKIDEEHATRMLRYAIDHGVNYVDTAYSYHEGDSERFLGRALKDGYRQRVYLATKLPSWLVTSSADFDRFLDEQLQRLESEYVDFYLLHTLNKGSWARLRDLHVLEWAEKAMASGRFRHLAFSFHDDAETFRRIVDAYDWAMCQIQYNYMDVDNQAGVQGLRYAASRGIAVVIMEPLLGGKLVDQPAPIRAIWARAQKTRSAAGWALQWLWDQPEVSTVLSGMSTLEQVKENVALAEASGVGLLTDEERALYGEVRRAYQDLTVIPCTKCGYCMPCSQGVDIPANFALYNEGLMYDKPEAARGQYAWWKHAHEVQGVFEHDIRAARCIECGECEAKCPQGIPISRWMPVIASVLGEGKAFVRTLEPAGG